MWPITAVGYQKLCSSRDYLTPPPPSKEGFIFKTPQPLQKFHIQGAFFNAPALAQSSTLWESPTMYITHIFLLWTMDLWSSVDDSCLQTSNRFSNSWIASLASHYPEPSHCSLQFKLRTAIIFKLSRCKVLSWSHNLQVQSHDLRVQIVINPSRLWLPVRSCESQIWSLKWHSQVKLFLSTLWQYGHLDQTSSTSLFLDFVLAFTPQNGKIWGQFSKLVFVLQASIHFINTYS